MDEFDKSDFQVTCKSDVIIEDINDIEDSDVHVNNKDDLFWVENEIVVAEDIYESSVVNDDDCRITAEKSNVELPVVVSDNNLSSTVSENEVKFSDSVKKNEKDENKDVENKLWKYFTEHNSSQLRCNLCSGLFIYQNNDSHLLSHIEAAHNIPMGFPIPVITSIPTQHESSTTGQTNQNPSNSKKTLESEVNDNWFNDEDYKKLLMYFTKMDNGGFRCNLCCRILYKLQQSKVFHHFKSYHADAFTSIIGLTSVQVSNFVFKEKKDSSRSKLMNFISHHFSKLKSPNKIRCNQCQTVLKNCDRNNYNLIKHLQKKHVASLIEINDILIEDSNEVISVDDQEKVVEFGGKDTIVIEATEEGENNFVVNTEIKIESFISLNEVTNSSALFEQEGNRLDDENIEFNICSNKVKNEVVTTNIDDVQRNELCNYFLRLESTDEMKCKLCSEVMHVDVNTLHEHLVNVHEDHIKNNKRINTKSNKEVIVCENVELKEADPVDCVKQFSRRRKHAIGYKLWKHFTKVYRYKAVCNFCKKIMRYSYGRVSNLIKHLQTRHFFELYKTKKVVNTIWKYFTVLDKRRAQCDLCKNPNIFFYSGGSTTNLVKHLRRMHTYFQNTTLENDKVDEENDVIESEKTKVDIDMKSLYDYFITDKTLSENIRYEDEQIVCQSCSGTFLCDDLINFEATIRYHVQNCHAVLFNNRNDSVFGGNNVISYYNDAIEGRELYNSEYNELEAITNEINSFDG